MHILEILKLQNDPMLPPSAKTYDGGARARETLGGVAREPYGFAFALGIVWLIFEFGRPPTPPGIPLLISAVMFLSWLNIRQKQWCKHSWWWFALLAIVSIGIPMAANTYSASFATRWMATLFLGVCLPMQALMTSVNRTRAWILAFIGVSLYVGGWAAFHGGYGPAGSPGGQDENYVAALMGMAIGLAYFSMLAEKSLAVRMLLASCMVVFVAAIALGSNPSRGGFIGLCAVAAYCVVRSPRKLVGVIVVTGIGVALMVIAGPGFWKEIETSTDYQTGTGDVRLELWKVGLRMWRANPFFGVGGGNYRWVIEDYQSARQFAKFGRGLGGTMIAHSLPVELLAELGTFGAIATAALVWFTWTGLGRLRVATPGLGQAVDSDLIRVSCYADAIRAGILAILVNGVFLSLLYYSHLWVLLAVGSALPFVHRRILARQAGVRPARSDVDWRTASSASLSPGEKAPSPLNRRHRSWGPR
jgi:O-antigen ligase